MVSRSISKLIPHLHLDNKYIFKVKMVRSVQDAPVPGAAQVYQQDGQVFQQDVAGAQLYQEGGQVFQEGGAGGHIYVDELGRQVILDDSSNQIFTGGEDAQYIIQNGELVLVIRE